MHIYHISQALAQSERLDSVSDSQQLDVELLLLEVLDKPRSYLYTWPDRQLTQAQQTRFEQLLNRRLNGEPVAYILGHWDFWTLRLEVNPSTLIPRPDTERLVELALEYLPDEPCRVADLGTGTGAVALALASERPDCQVYGVEYNADAKALAERNRQHLGFNNASMLQGSWCEPLINAGESALDMIVSNPPYIDPDDRHLSEGDVRFEPTSALIAEQQGLADIITISEQAHECLRPGGWLLLEHGYDQGARVRQCLQDAGYQQVRTFTDLGNNDRVSLGRR